MKQKRTYKLLPISNAISRVYKNNSGQNDSQFIGLMKNWDKIIGGEYAKILSPVKVSSKAKSLVISSEKNFSLEANYVAPMLLEKINSFYGYKAFNKIDFLFKSKSKEKKEKNIALKPETKEKIEGIVCNINNNDLKETLERLGKSMAKKGKIK
jgi:hypothetical protein